MPKIRKSKEELEAELAEQVNALRASARGYDDGHHWEAKRLASTIYILLHDGSGRTKSLMGLVGKKDGLSLLSSLVIWPPVRPEYRIVAAAAAPLLLIKSTADGTQFVPMLGDGPFRNQFRWLPFAERWNECIFHPVSKIELSRKNIISLCAPRTAEHMPMII